MSRAPCGVRGGALSAQWEEPGAGISASHSWPWALLPSYDPSQALLSSSTKWAGVGQCSSGERGHRELQEQELADEEEPLLGHRG